MKTVITAALPYANGPLHLGHMVEYIQADVFARFLRLSGKDAIFVCADDTHGTPIEINAAKQGTTPEEFVKKYHEEHLKDFTDFLISFDSYYSTNAPENKQYADEFFTAHKDNIYEKEIEQAYCETDKRFLPDRYVKGTCPKCEAKEQYGDQCEVCNATYKPTDLKDAKCSLCGKPPATKKSTHYFFRLSAFADMLSNYISSNQNFQPEVKNFVLNWIKEGLHDWDISRDGPYFGFPIKGEEDKFYYVWWDAPIGYIASTANYCRGKECKVSDFWKDGRIIHFIGKDITYHHFLFWPAMLKGAGYSLPEDIVVHGHLTVNGEKMSKSRGTFITARQFLDEQNPEFLRFYYASNQAHVMADFDLDETDFKNRINSELVGNIANFAYRTLSFANNSFGSELSEVKEPEEVIAQFNEKIEAVKRAYEAYNNREAVKIILEIAAMGNKYFQEHEPWQLLKTDKKRCSQVVTFAANIARNLSILLAPILPKYSLQLQKQLGLDAQSMNDTGFTLEKAKINKARIIYTKIEERALPIYRPKTFPLNLKVAQVTAVAAHPDADKLLVLQLDLGSEKRQLVAGLAGHYDKEQLVGRKIVMIANLKPAKLRGELSEGMLLAADDGEHVIILEAPNSQPGERVTVDGMDNDEQQITYEQFAKLTIKTQDKKALYEGKKLRSETEDVYVNIGDGCRVR